MTFVSKSRSAILVIEDDGLMRMLYEALLSRWGHAVRCAASTSEAIAACESGFIPDAIISDYHLGEDDTGAIAIRALFDRLGRAIPATIITGEPEAIAAGDVPVLPKPVMPERLKEVVAGMLRPRTTLTPAGSDVAAASWPGKPS